MGAVANAASLMQDPTWKSWVTAASAFTAVAVYTEATNTPDHDARLRLALDVLTSPDFVTQRLIAICSTTVAIANAGPTPVTAHENLLIARVAEVWTTLAKTTYPAP